MKTSFSWFNYILPGIMIQAIPGFIEAQPQQFVEDVEFIQKQLKPDEVILEYVVTDSMLQVNAIAQESTLSAAQSLNQLFWSSLQLFQKKLRSADPSDFLISGEILYLFLIKPIQSIIAGRHRLIIKPDDKLSGIPFEAFIRSDSPNDSGNLSKRHYLIHDFEVVYRGTGICWKERGFQRGSNHPVNPDDYQFAFMGFSPEFEKNKHINALPASKNEVAEIGELFRQQGLSSWLVYNEYSEEQYFKSMAHRGHIVHLATHCIPDNMAGNEGGLIFWDYEPDKVKDQPMEGLLTRDEIKALQLEADLVVLNACASGIDRMTTGSRKRALPELLLMAGARNILSTLWNVTDNLASHFMLDFYRAWLSGKTYSEALRAVKLQWINCTPTTLPTVWAPYVLTGE
jgi:CHAT domain-containing protein